MQTAKRLLTACVLVTLGNALSLNTKEDDTCTKMEEVGPISSVSEGEVIENVIIIAPPDTDIALKITKDNVTIRNVIVYHPANGMGIYGWTPNNLTIENVEVIDYGNDWGA